MLINRTFNAITRTLTNRSSYRNMSEMPAMQALPGYATTWATVKEGDGDAIVAGATATVHAKGVVKETGKKVRRLFGGGLMS